VLKFNCKGWGGGQWHLNNSRNNNNRPGCNSVEPCLAGERPWAPSQALQNQTKSDQCGWSCGLMGRETAQQVHGPEFKP
jgi:hypothetical protein